MEGPKYRSQHEVQSGVWLSPPFEQYPLKLEGECQESPHAFFCALGGLHRLKGDREVSRRSTPLVEIVGAQLV